MGMMTTGYDCEDILNLALLRPVFSPTDFVQMKGRGTRKFTFHYKDQNGEVVAMEKESFKFFDFFANFEYFEEKFNYDDALDLPSLKGSSGGPGPEFTSIGEYESLSPDKIRQLTEKPIGPEGMKIDRKLFEQVKEEIQRDEEIVAAVGLDKWNWLK